LKPNKFQMRYKASNQFPNNIVAMCGQCKHWPDCENLGSWLSRRLSVGVTTIIMHLSSPKCGLCTSRLQSYWKC